VHRGALWAIHIRVPEAWIEIVARDGTRRRHLLKSGLTTVGGRRGDVALEGSGEDQLHFWDQPPKVVYLGAGDPPRIRGAILDEAPIAPGDVVEWRGARIELGGLTHAVIEEIPISPPVSMPPASVASVAPAGAVSGAGAGAPWVGSPGAGFEPAPPPMSGTGDVAWRRLRAGLLIEQGLVEAGIARRWQEAVMRGEFDPDACARDVLGATTSPAADQRLLERSARLTRDLVMSPVQQSMTRGASRKARSMFKTGLAAAIVQFLVFGICTLLVVVAMFVARLRLGWSVDDFLDRIANLFGGS
jgi:hypothetical protein